VRKAGNLTTILCRCHEIWEPYLPGTLWAPRACNGTDLPLLTIVLLLLLLLLLVVVLVVTVVVLTVVVIMS